MKVTCPHCARAGSLKANVPIGTKVRCPGCRQTFEVQPEPADDQPDWDAIGRPADDAPAAADLPDILLDADDDPPQTAATSPNTPASSSGTGPTGAASAASQASAAAPSSGQPPAPGAATGVPTAASPGPRPVPVILPGATSTIPSAILGFAAAILILIAMGVGAAGLGMYDPRSYNNRFKDDNASGATANAVEFIAKKQELGQPEGWLIAGLLCLLIGSVEKLRRAVLLTAR